MRFDFVTLFPEIVSAYFSQGILHQGLESGLFDVQTTYLRDFGKGNYKQVDDRVFGGGAGMLLMFRPIEQAISKIKEQYKELGIKKYKVIATSAKGVAFKQSVAKTFLAEEEALIILCGRYEGFDQRIIEKLVDLEVSIGNFVLSGGEIAGLAIADSVARMIPGVLGKEESFQHDSFFDDDTTIQYPQYTRPEVIEYEGDELKVPPVLLSGNHAEIENWRQQHSQKLSEKVED